MAKRKDRLPKATELQTLMKIHEALQKDLFGTHDGEETRNKSEKRRNREKDAEALLRQNGQSTTSHRQDIATHNSWQDIAEYLENADDGVEYRTGRSTIYNLLKRFEEEFNVPFEYRNPKAKDLPEEQRRKQQKIYRYPEGFKNDELQDYIEAQIVAGGGTIDLKEYLDNLDEQNSLSIWTKLFIENLTCHRQLMKAVAFYENDSLMNHYELFGELLEKVIKKVPIRFYVHGKDKTTGEPKIRLVRMHPYLLKNYNQRWYLIGRVKNEKIDTEIKYYEPFSPFAINEIVIDPIVDGIKEKTVEDWTEAIVQGKRVRIKYDGTTNTEECMDAYKAAVGVTLSGEKQKVVLKFPTWRYEKYVRTKPIVSGDYQKNGKPCDDGKYTIVQIETYLTKELEQQILSFGPDCEVVSPPELRDKIAEMIDSMVNLYRR